LFLGYADVIQLVGPVFLPLLMALWRRRPVVIEHHGYQAICPNGLLFYEPARIICPGHFMAGRYDLCLRCNAATAGWLGSLRMLLLTFLRRWMCGKADLNAPITEHVSRRLGLPNAQVIYYGVPSPNIERQAIDPLPDSAPICFAYLGRLVTEKGLPLLLEAAARLKEQGYQFRLKFIGDGPERRRLQELATAKGLEQQVVFTGFLQGEALSNALQDVAAVVMPSICEETAGLAAMEQMIRGRLVIASDVGGLGEVVGEAGLKFPAGDVEALTSCLREVLGRPALVNDIGRRARSRALERFNQERMVEEHIRSYLGIVNRRHSGK
jgi:glycosyltransferase involved in cell wall biosynthesis